MTETKTDKKYVGLWIATDRNNNTYLSGKDSDTNIKYFVFSDNKDNTIKRLCKAEEGKEIETIGTLEKKTNDFGEFMVCEGHLVAENRYYVEGTKRPEYQVCLPTK